MEEGSTPRRRVRSYRVFKDLIGGLGDNAVNLRYFKYHQRINFHRTTEQLRGGGGFAVTITITCRAIIS